MTGRRPSWRRGIFFKGKGCTIVDFGTTLSIDFTSEEGLYQGGNISLGFRTRFKALSRYSRSLPLVDSPESPDLLGLSEKAPSRPEWFQASYLKWKAT